MPRQDSLPGDHERGAVTGILADHSLSQAGGNDVYQARLLEAAWLRCHGGSVTANACRRAAEFDGGFFPFADRSQRRMAALCQRRVLRHSRSPLLAAPLWIFSASKNIRPSAAWF